MAVWLAEPSAGSWRSGRLGEATLPIHGPPSLTHYPKTRHAPSCHSGLCIRGSLRYSGRGREPMSIKTVALREKDLAVLRGAFQRFPAGL